VQITRELGSPEGYGNRLEAIAAARLAKAEPAAVLQDQQGKWHAVETTTNCSGGMAAADSATRAVEGLPSSAGISDLRNDVINLRRALQEPQNQTSRDEMIDELSHKQKELASLIFGVPQSDINIDYKHPVPGKINLVPSGQLPGGATGATTLGPGDDFAHRPVTIELDINKLTDRAGAEGALFHEATHAQDFDLAKQWVGKFEQQTSHKFTSSDSAQFQGWLQGQVSKGDLSEADREIVMSEVNGGRGIPEARAHVHAALAALQGGNPTVASRELVNYVVDLKNHEYSNLANDGNTRNGAAVRDALTHEIQATYRHLPPDMQRALEDAISSARQQNPDAWLSTISLQK
jgi:hypothetical protein